jgi:hypothetical protein
MNQLAMKLIQSRALLKMVRRSTSCCGTIKRGFEIYEYENTPEGYELSKQILSRLWTLLTEIQVGKKLYEIYCISCVMVQLER